MKLKFTESEVEITNDAETKRVPWDDISSLRFPLFGKSPTLGTRSFGKIALRLPAEDLAREIPTFFANWKKVNPHLAQKMAFDYAEPPKQGAWLLIVLATCFCFVLGSMLWLETYTQYSCTQAFRENSVLEKNPEILKLKKKKRGNFEVELRFNTPDGLSHGGKRMTMETYKAGNDPEQFSVVYAASKPSCWVLSGSSDAIDVNWARRRALTAFDFFVGLCFFITGCAALYAGIRRLQEVRPGREQVLALLNVNLR